MNDPDNCSFIFSAPFRTNIEMDHFSALEPVLVDDFLKEVSDALNASQEQSNNWRTTRQREKGNDLKFANLDEQMLPWTASPIAVLKVETDILLEVSNRVGDPFGGPEAFKIERCSVRYYDNTIAVMVCEVSIERTPEDVLEVVDTWSTMLCQSLIGALAMHRHGLENELRIRGQEKPNRGLFAEPGKLKRFTDRNSSLKEDARTMLWTTRILASATQPRNDCIAKWTQSQIASGDWLEMGSASLLVRVGNSVLAGDISKRELRIVENMIALSTFFYVSQELLRHHLKLMHVDIGRAVSGTTKASFTSKSLSDLRNHVDLMEGEFDDCRLGLQGHAKAVSDRLLAIWDYDDLRSSVLRKCRSVEVAWTLLQEKRRRKYNAIVESVLAVIAGVALLDFILSLFDVASNQDIPDDSITGLIDAAREMSPDLTLYAILLVLLLLPLLIWRNRP